MPRLGEWTMVLLTRMADGGLGDAGYGDDGTLLLCDLGNGGREHGD